MEFISDVPADIVIYEMDQISFQNEFRPVVRFLPEWVVEVCKMRGNEKMIESTQGRNGVFNESNCLYWWTEDLGRENHFCSDEPREERKVLMINKNYDSRAFGKSCRTAVFVSWLELKLSTLCPSVFGLYARREFKRGEIITICSVQQQQQMMVGGKVDDEVLLLGGSLGIDLNRLGSRLIDFERWRYIKPECKTNNARMTRNGLIRATQLIRVGHEVFVDYSQEGVHPVDLLDCVLIGDQEATVFPWIGRVVDYEENGAMVKTVFLVELFGGKKIQMDTQNVLARVMFRPGW